MRVAVAVSAHSTIQGQLAPAAALHLLLNLAELVLQLADDIFLVLWPVPKLKLLPVLKLQLALEGAEALHSVLRAW